MRSPERFYPESDYLHPAFHFRRLMWATVVALACGVIGITVGLFSVVTGDELEFLRAQSKSNVGYADELNDDFAALRGAETIASPAVVSDGAQMPIPAEVNISVPVDDAEVGKPCPEGTWAFFDDNCPWGTSPPQRHRRRIVLRLKSPWCAGLRDTVGTYNCRGLK